jgi:hypothetical protein
MDGMMVLKELDYNSDQEDSAYRLKVPEKYTREEILLLFGNVYVSLKLAF